MACSDLCRSAVNELRVLTLSLLCVAGEMEDRWRRRVERERERERFYAGSFSPMTRA